MSMYAPGVGKLIPQGEDALRDAIHLAVAPVLAAEYLRPGQRVVLVGGRAQGVSDGDPAVGVVDPFLTVAVREGQRFWLFLYPGTVTSLRHVWTHPAFMTTPLPPREG